MRGYAQFNIPWLSAACQSESGLDDIGAYRASVATTDGSAWMDNTTLATATILMSDDGPPAMTPMTIWDLATFARAVACYDRVYHHKHPDIDDAAINGRLGAQVLVPVPLPFRPVAPGHLLPDPWDGAFRFMCDVWASAESWLRRLSDALDTNSLDGQQVRAVADAWAGVLGRKDLDPRLLVNWSDVDHRWQSPTNQLLVDMTDLTSVQDTQIYVDPTEGFQALAARRRELGLPDGTDRRRDELLSDLNIRAYVNQRMAEFFELPYACSLARLPYRRQLYDRATRIQQEATSAGVIDDRYAELAEGVHLRLPVFLAIAMRDAARPADLWPNLGRIRAQSGRFREHRVELDSALARGDLKVARNVGRALTMSVDDVLSIAGAATIAAASAVIERVAQGDVEPVATGISALKAAASPILKSSFSERLVWRLRRPQLLWINDVIEQASHLTEALPDVSRIWELPLNRQAVFAERFRATSHLSGDPLRGG